MIPVVTKANAEEVKVGDTWTCVDISSEAVDSGDVELVRVDFAAEVATIRYLGKIMAGPIMIRTDHPNHMGKEVAVLFV